MRSTARVVVGTLVQVGYGDLAVTTGSSSVMFVDSWLEDGRFKEIASLCATRSAGCWSRPKDGRLEWEGNTFYFCAAAAASGSSARRRRL
jgi:hypothetical protein